MGFLGTFLEGKDKSSSTSNYTPNVPQWLKDNYETNTAKAAELANATADERVAGFSQDQLSVQSALRGLLGQGSSNYQSGIDAILGQLGGSGNQMTPDSYKQYMDPYINEVIQNQNNELVRTADINRNNIRGNAAMTNAFGGGRADLMEQEANRNLGQQISTNTASGMSNAFNWANNMAMQANTNNTANTTGLASSLANLTGAQSSNVISQANALNTVGNQQQQLAQSQLDVPYTNVNWLSSILGQIPASIYGATTTGQTVTPGAGWGSQVLGLASSAAGLTGFKGFADGGLVSPVNISRTDNELFSMQQRLAQQNSSDIEQAKKDAAARKEEIDSQSGGGGLSDLIKSLTGGGSGGVSDDTGGANGQAMLDIASSVMMAANGGYITKNYADGGLTSSPNSFVDMYRKIKGGYVNPALEGLSGAFENFGKPSMVMDPSTGKMTPNNSSTPTKAETQAAAYSNVDDSLIKEQEAEIAKQLQDKQAAAPKVTSGDPERNFMDSVLQNGMLPPPRESESPTEPSSAVTDVTQAAVNPVVADTTKQATEGPMSGIIAKYLENQRNAVAAGEKTDTEKTWMDRINLPLVMAGAAMMGSNKPFAGALSEGLNAGAGQVARERSAKAEAELKTKIASQENAQKLLDSMINAQYRDEQTKQAIARNAISDRAVTVQEKQQAVKEKNAAGNERKAMEFARKQTESELKLFLNTPQGITASKDEVDAMRSRLQQKYYDNYLIGSFGDVAGGLPNSVQSDLNDNSENTGGMLDYNSLMQKFGQQ